MSTLFASLTSDLRARASYLPPCPVCSFVGITDNLDILRGPSHRTVQLPDTAENPPRVVHKLTRCCLISDDCPAMESQAEVAGWWRARRRETLNCLATDNRRRNCLKKLAALNLEPL